MTHTNIFYRGEKVLVRNNLIEIPNTVGINSSMQSFEGKIVTVAVVSQLRDRYRIEEDGEFYVWESCLFSKITYNFTQIDEL